MDRRRDAGVEKRRQSLPLHHGGFLVLDLYRRLGHPEHHAHVRQLILHLEGLLVYRGPRELPFYQPLADILLLGALPLAVRHDCIKRVEERLLNGEFCFAFQHTFVGEAQIRRWEAGRR